MTPENIVEILKKAPRMGNSKDEPEGSRYIKISDTLANQMVDTLSPPADKPQKRTKAKKGKKK